MDIDFIAFEKELHERFVSTLNKNESDRRLSETFGLIAARVSTMAIQEYHKLLRSENTATHLEDDPRTS